MQEPKVIITGGSGFLGTSTAARLLARGCAVVILDIVPPRDASLPFVKANLAEAIPEDPLLEHPTAVINLAGAPIFGRWNKKKKKGIYNSRVVGTRNLVSFFENKKYRPQYFVSASAVGYFGDRGDELLYTQSSGGYGFLAHVAQSWETEAQKASQLGITTTIIRNGHILGKKGLLGVMLPFYMYGVGGPLGSGKQWMPWIHIDDCVALYVRAAMGEDNPEIIHAVAPDMVRNVAFSKLVAETVHRPHIFFIPTFALRLLYGGFADEMTTSQRVAMSAGSYVFTFPNLKGALANLLKDLT